MRKLKDEAAFWRELRKLRGLKWGVTTHGKIRCARGDCPIVAVGRALGAQDHLSNKDAPELMTDLAFESSEGWSPTWALRLRWLIIDAADTPRSPDRPRLLRTIGLKETVSK